MLFKSSLYVLAFAFFAAFTVPSHAQTTDGLKIAVLDVNSIRRDAASVKSIRQQITNFRNQFQSEIQKEQDAIRTANQELAKKRSLLAPEAFADERQKFEQRVVDAQRLVQQRRGELDAAQNKAMLQVERALNEIVATVANQQGYSLVLRRAQTVVVDVNLDITKAVLAELDKNLPTVTVAKPGQ